tara:strand:- start:666 stop:1169 length:504 start_codon:yes stop_codon:yes gene_type:complete
MSAPSTPKQEEMDSASSTADVKIAVASVEAINPGIPMQAKLAHVLAAFVSATIALCVAAVLADGKSVIKLKDVDALPIITDEDATGLHYRADELVRIPPPPLPRWCLASVLCSRVLAPHRDSSAPPTVSACTTTSPAARGTRPVLARPSRTWSRTSACRRSSRRCRT